MTVKRERPGPPRGRDPGDAEVRGPWSHPLDSIWSRAAPGSRRPRFSREQIAEAALEIADREGFAAVSMRRLAEALGAATMTLYHYVRTKEDVVALMDDALMGQVLLSDEELAQGYPETMRTIARKTRDVFVRHPWALVELRGARGGPNGLRHVEQSVAALADTDLNTNGKLELLGIIDDFVFGHALRSRWMRSRRHVDVEQVTAYAELFVQQVRSGDYPHLAGLLGRGDPVPSMVRWMRTMNSDDAFERGLAALLAMAATPKKRSRR